MTNTTTTETKTTTTQDAPPRQHVDACNCWTCAIAAARTKPHFRRVKQKPAPVNATPGNVPWTREQSPNHDCYDNAVQYRGNGPIGHGWECGLCGAFLQAG